MVLTFNTLKIDSFANNHSNSSFRTGPKALYRTWQFNLIPFNN